MMTRSFRLNVSLLLPPFTQTPTSASGTLALLAQGNQELRYQREEREASHRAPFGEKLGGPSM